MWIHVRHVVIFYHIYYTCIWVHQAPRLSKGGLNLLKINNKSINGERAEERDTELLPSFLVIHGWFSSASCSPPTFFGARLRKPQTSNSRLSVSLGHAGNTLVFVPSPKATPRCKKTTTPRHTDPILGSSIMFPANWRPHDSPVSKLNRPAAEKQQKNKLWDLSFPSQSVWLVRLFLILARNSLKSPEGTPSLAHDWASSTGAWSTKMGPFLRGVWGAKKVHRVLKAILAGQSACWSSTLVWRLA